MNEFIDFPIVWYCKNLEESYGEICVQCNRCGRFDKKGETLKDESEDK